MNNVSILRLLKTKVICFDDVVIHENMFILFSTIQSFSPNIYIYTNKGTYHRKLESIRNCQILDFG